MTTVADILGRIRELLEAGYTFGPIDDDASLIEEGYIDSVSIVGLTLELEKRFGIQIPSSEMTPENWSTARSIASMCARLLITASDGPPPRSMFDLIYGAGSLVNVLRGELARALRAGSCVSLVVFQLDGQMQDSDTAVMAETWMEAGQTLAQNLRLEDTVTLIKLPDGKSAMLGILPHATGASVAFAVRRVGRRLISNLAGRYPVNALQYSVSTFPDHGREIQDLIQRSCSSWQQLTMDEASNCEPGPQAQGK